MVNVLINLMVINVEYEESTVEDTKGNQWTFRSHVSTDGIRRYQLIKGLRVDTYTEGEIRARLLELLQH